MRACFGVPIELRRGLHSLEYGSLRKLWVPYVGVLIIRMLLFRVVH